MLELKKLDVDELEKLGRVEGEDQALRAARLSDLREAEAKLRSETTNRDAVAGGSNFDNRLVCVLCCGSFSLFSRGTQCQSCDFQVCGACLAGQCCRLCRQAKDFKQREADWARFSPFPSSSFAVAKLTVPRAPPAALFDWQERGHGGAPCPANSWRLSISAR